MNEQLVSFELWVEGYACNGDQGVASCFGTVEGTSFDDAVSRYVGALDYAENWRRDGDGKWIFWGCRVFDNEAAARERFG